MIIVVIIIVNAAITSGDYGIINTIFCYDLHWSSLLLLSLLFYVSL